MDNIPIRMETKEESLDGEVSEQVSTIPYNETELKLLSNIPRDASILLLFDENRSNETNDLFLHACGTVPIFQFEEIASRYRNASILEDFRGTVTLHDVRCYGKDIEEETTSFEPVTEDGLKFGLLKVMGKHSTLYKMNTKTMVLGLNPCGILTDNQDMMRVLVQGIVNTKDGIQNFFDMDSIIFPIYYREHSFCILVHKPKGILQPDEQCTILSIGTGDMAEFKLTMWPRVLRILEAFRIAMQEDRINDVLNIRRVVCTVPKMRRHERPFQLLFIVDKMLKNRFNMGDYMENGLRKLGNNQRRMVADIRLLRCWVADQMHTEHILNPNELSTYVINKRIRAMHYRAKKRAQDIEAGIYKGPLHLKWPAIRDTGESPAGETDDVTISIFEGISD